MEPDHAALEQRCRATVDLLMAKHEWRLVDREKLIRHTVEQILSGIGADPQRVAVGVYSQALHAACSGAEGPARQNAGYAELSRYLYDLARWRYPDVREDATQRALERIYTSFERCRLPIAFLAFAIQHLMDAARATRRQENRPLLERQLGDDDTREAPLDERDGPLEQALSDEQREMLERRRAEFMRANPRASQQLDALWMKYIDGLDDAAIGEQLGVSVKNVYVLRSRAIKRLRSDPEWRDLAIEFGILPDR